MQPECLIHGITKLRSIWDSILDISLPFFVYNLLKERTHLSYVTSMEVEYNPVRLIIYS